MGLDGSGARGGSFKSPIEVGGQDEVAAGTKSCSLRSPPGDKRKEKESEKGKQEVVLDVGGSIWEKEHLLDAKMANGAEAKFLIGL